MTVSVKGGGQGDQPPPNPPTTTTTPKTTDSTTPTNPATQTPNTTEVSQQDNADPKEEKDLLLPNGEPNFPIAELARLDEMINRQRWVVPVLPKGELEVLLEASIKLCRAGYDTKSEECQRFFREGLTMSFHKILNDEAVNGWKYEIHKCILKDTEKLIELCVLKLSQDWFPLLDLLSLVFNPLSRPFGYCAEVLTTQTVEKYFLPIIEFVPVFLEGLSDDELKKEAKNEAKNDALSSVIKALKKLGTRITNREDIRKQLEIFRLKMILRLLQISSFNGKMNALNEINKVISSVSYYTHPHAANDDKEWLTAERMAEWIGKNNVLSIVLKDNLHQPQYVEKLEKIIRFIIKEKALSLKDLDSIWAAQIGKHDAIVKNIHDLLAKLAWDFSAEQLDHLFSCFQESWANASKKQREKLLELIRRLAEDDKEGVMAHKVLGLLWSLTHSDDVPTDIMDLALSAHIKILDYSCSQDRDSQKTQWIDRCVEELRNDTWVLPALKHIKEICMLFYEAPQNYSHVQRNPHVFYRHEVINKLQQTHSLVNLVADNLAKYMEKVHVILEGKPTDDAQELILDGRYNHIQQVQERLTFLKFLLKDGQLWLCEPQAKLLMGDEPDLDPEISLSFFEGNVLKLDPVYLTENGIRCFERFFRGVNIKEKKVLRKRRSYVMQDLNLIGMDYVWQVVLHSSSDIANRAIELIKETFTNLGPNLRDNQVEIHNQFIQTCTSRIQESAKVLLSSNEEDDKVEGSKSSIAEEAIKVVRCLTVLREYVSECDDDHLEERAILPHGR
ncbi:hypothetical protein QZH41_000977 [Actinostola sp. cb2023]|nr:hypothetical protein QZH41_000977 [Actinostola sp. cb2023]